MHKATSRFIEFNFFYVLLRISSFYSYEERKMILIWVLARAEKEKCISSLEGNILFMLKSKNIFFLALPPVESR